VIELVSYFIEDTGPIEPDLNRIIAFEDLPDTCQRCLMSGREWDPAKGRK
jgi:hypothetical protein